MGVHGGYGGGGVGGGERRASLYLQYAHSADQPHLLWSGRQGRMAGTHDGWLMFEYISCARGRMQTYTQVYEGAQVVREWCALPCARKPISAFF